MGDFRATAKEIHDCGNYYLNTVSQNFFTVKMTAKYEGCNPTGFEALLLEPLAILLESAKGPIDEAFEMAQTKMIRLGETLTAAAKAYDQSDQNATSTINRTGNSRGEIAI